MSFFLLPWQPRLKDELLFFVAAIVAVAPRQPSEGASALRMQVDV